MTFTISWTPNSTICCWIWSLTSLNTPARQVRCTWMFINFTCTTLKASTINDSLCFVLLYCIVQGTDAVDCRKLTRWWVRIVCVIVCGIIPSLSVFALDRQQCALWIKKLCDPAACGSGLTGRKNRNMYARLLVQMLKRGVLELPFTSRPEPGSLKTLPTYMARTSSSPVGFNIRTLLFSPHRFKSSLPL